MSQPLTVVFAEEDTLFRLMEMALIQDWSIDWREPAAARSQ